MDFWRNNGTFKYEKSSAAFRNAEREAAHHILYMILNAQYVNFGYDPATDGITITRAAVNGKWWIALLVAGDVLLIAANSLADRLSSKAFMRSFSTCESVSVDI